MNRKEIRIAIILEAAGDAKRFGSNKLLHRLDDGQPMVSRILKAVRIADSSMSFDINKASQGSCLFYRKILVTQYDEVASLAPDFEIIRNLHPEYGISHSMQLGIYAAGDADAYMFCVCDQPGITSDALIRMIDAYRDVIASNSANSTSLSAPIISLAWRGSLHNPKIFSSKYRDELMALDGDMGGRQIIKNHENNLILVEAGSEDEVKDIDIPENIMKNDRR